jgi:hypothetical protein
LDNSDDNKKSGKTVMSNMAFMVEILFLHWSNTSINIRIEELEMHYNALRACGQHGRCVVRIMSRMSYTLTDQPALVTFFLQQNFFIICMRVSRTLAMYVHHKGYSQG